MDLNNYAAIGIIRGDIKGNDERCTFDLEVTDGFGEKEEKILFPCSAMKKTAEVLLKYCKDNSKICVEGAVKKRKMDGSLYIAIRRIQMLGKGFEKKSETKKEELDW
jgi:single-stranded DNA-binding protein